MTGRRFTSVAEEGGQTAAATTRWSCIVPLIRDYNHRGHGGDGNQDVETCKIVTMVVIITPIITSYNVKQSVTRLSLNKMDDYHYSRSYHDDDDDDGSVVGLVVEWYERIPTSNDVFPSENKSSHHRTTEIFCSRSFRNEKKEKKNNTTKNPALLWMDHHTSPLWSNKKMKS